jgi:hypothetical protein
MDAPVRKFAWSWSRLRNWRTCPKRHYHLDLAKDIVEEESVHIKWGHEFHEAVANHITDGTELPFKTKSERWVTMLRERVDANCDVKTEQQLAMDADFQPTEWFGADTWFRGVVDVLALDGDERYAVALDWKTGGTIRPDEEQLALNAQLIFAHTSIDTVHTAYQWTQFDEYTLKTYTRNDMVPLWVKLLPEVKKMESDAAVMHYPPKPSGLCKNHCPVRQCQYHGKGGRMR